METLSEILSQAQRSGVAVGHFNFSDLVTLKAVFSAAQELNVPVMVGVSEGERALIGVRQAAALVKSLRDEHNYPIFLNADHTHSLSKAEEAARAGFDEIIFDRSELSFEQNVAETRRGVEAIKSINPSVLVEGEIGYIGTASEILDKAPEGMSSLTTAEQARQFMEETRIDVLAPAVGNMHGLLQGMVRGQAQKRLDVERIRQIEQATGIFLTLHGGSGTNDDDFKKAIQAGITIIHINTELRLAWRRGLEAALAGTGEVAPYKILPGALEAITKIVRERLRLFNFRDGSSAQGEPSRATA
ncbi:MAG: class II fructose-bisphosphate aldolase [Acidobacteriia bacterium]|nr:class II fructose-bisphosphate aldolase [Terriglobia bacterium]